MRTPARSTFLKLFLCAFACLLNVSTGKAQSASPDTIQAVKLVSGQSGWLLANSRLFWTDSVGASWAEITPANPATPLIDGAFFSPAGKGWALLSSQDSATLNVAQTADKGQHWSYAAIASPFTEATPFSGKANFYFADSQNGWMMLGLQSSSAFRRGLLLRTTDAGAHWTQQPMPPVGGDLYFTDATHGFTGPGPNGDELFATADAGQTWHPVALPTPSAALAQVHSTVGLPVFTTASAGTLLRTYVGDAGTTVVPYTTANAGLTWQPAASPVTGTSPVLAADGTLIPRVAANSTQAKGITQVASLIAVRSSFATASAGLVLFAGGQCDHATGVCTQTKSLMGTLDGGKTYFSLGAIPGLDLESTTQTALPAKVPAASFQSPVIRPASSYPVTGVQGFDACSLPTVAQMQTWYGSSPYLTAGLYIGGDEFACSSGLSAFTAGYTSSVLAQGWEIVPIWVGPQAPGAGYTYSISSDPTTATTQGVTEADSAAAQMTTLGMNQGSTVVYDMEAYTYTNATYAAATTAFLDGWVSELHAKGYLAGVYSGHYEFENWYPGTVTPAIDTIWFTYYFTAGISCGSTCWTVYPTQSAFTPLAPYWLNHHRSRQTSSAINPVYNGLTLNVDEDYTDAAFEVAESVTLTAAKSGTGTGTVATATINNSLDTSIDTAIACGASCTTASAHFAPTDTVTLTATPATGSAFVSWSGCTSVTSSTCTVATAASSTVTANFVSTVTYALTVAKSGTGTGTVTSADGYISCGTTCSAAYTIGNAVTLTATPATGSVFGSWSGCTTTSGTTCKVTTGSAAATVTVTFNPAPTFAAALSVSTLSIVGGNSATDTITLSPQVGYTGNFTPLACTGLPSSATCTFSPTTLTALGDGAPLTSTLTITTIPVFTASVQSPSRFLFAGLLFPSLLLPLVLRRKKVRVRIVSLLALMLLAVGTSQLAGCTAGNPAPYSTVAPGVPFSGTINVSITSPTGVRLLPIQLSITSK